MAPADSGYGAI